MKYEIESLVLIRTFLFHTAPPPPKWETRQVGSSSPYLFLFLYFVFSWSSFYSARRRWLHLTDGHGPNSWTHAFFMSISSFPSSHFLTLTLTWLGMMGRWNVCIFTWSGEMLIYFSHLLWEKYLSWCDEMTSAWYVDLSMHSCIIHRTVNMGRLVQVQGLFQGKRKLFNLSYHISESIPWNNLRI
jgi:hypothetical protein